VLRFKRHAQSFKAEKMLLNQNA